MWKKGPIVNFPLMLEKGALRKAIGLSLYNCPPCCLSVMFFEKIVIAQRNPTSLPTIWRHDSRFLFFNLHVLKMYPVENRYIRRRRQNFKKGKIKG